MADNQLTTASLPFRNFFINSYILPGFLFLLTTLLICIIFRVHLPEWMYFSTDEFNAQIENGYFIDFLTKEFSLFAQVVFIFILIFISIIIGNAISVLSTLIFDLLWMGKGIGWPYERILSYYPRFYITRAIHITLFTVLHLVCILYVFGWIENIKIAYWSIFLIFLFKDGLKKFYNSILGDDDEIRVEFKKLTQNRKRKLFETMWLMKRVLFNKSKRSKFINYAIYFLSLLFILDLSVILAIILGKFFGISHGLDKSSRKRFAKKFKLLNPKSKLKNNTNVYWTTYIALVHKNPENIRIANSHLKRSILIRNLAMVGVLVLFILLSIKPESNHPDFLRWLNWTKIWWVSAFLLFIGYNIVIHKYYTKYLIRCFILDENIKESTTHNN